MSALFTVKRGRKNGGDGGDSRRLPAQAGTLNKRTTFVKQSRAIVSRGSGARNDERCGAVGIAHGGAFNFSASGLFRRSICPPSSGIG